MNDETLELAPEGVDQLMAEADAAIAGAPPDPLAPPQPGVGEGAPPLDPGAAWRPTVKPAVKMVSIMVLPQWGLSDEEKDEFTEATSECLSQIFPDGPGGKYACWFRLLTVSGFIVAGRMMANGGKLPGFGPKKPDPDPVPDHAAAAPAAA